jgi:cytochrome P450
VFYSTVVNAWVVTRYDDVISVLRAPEVFGPGVEHRMVSEPCAEADRILARLPALDQVKINASEPPVHTKLRRYLQSAFFPHKVAQLEPKFRAMANDLIDGFAPRGRADLYRDYSYPFSLSVVSSYIGLPEEDRIRTRAWIEQIQKLRYTYLTAEEQVAAANGMVEAYDYTLELVHRRRAEAGDDLMSWIIQDSDSSEDALTDRQLASQALTLISAGHETTAHFLTMLVHLVLEDPSRWAALVEDPSTTSPFVEEALRISGPVQSLWRRAKADTEVGGIPIRAGERLSLLLGSANVDDRIFQTPERVDVTRANVAQHMAFGRGIHTCVGAGLARLEANLSLELLATRLPTLRLSGTKEVRFVPSSSQRAARGLDVEWST